MPHILQPDGSDDPRSTDEQFLQLLLDDGDLLKAEFEAIIAGEWPGPSPERSTDTRRADVSRPER